jgi:hypothetical protein
MAYGVKYRLEFTDIQQDDWKVDILEDSYAGAISAMTPSGNPLTIEWLTPSDDLTLGPIKGSMATINVECTTNFEYIGLYDEEDLVRPVNVYKNDVLYWTGWLSNEYSEPYDNVPYTVSITAADGLGILKNIAYKNAGVDYTGRVTADSIIKIVLGHLGHTSYIEYCNVYEDRMDDAVDNSVFDQELIDNDLFIDADCYSVLSAILSKLNAVIRQSGGKFIIYRPTELVADTVYGREMVTGAIAGVTLSPDKVLDRDAMDLIDFNGGVLMLQTPMRRLTVKQDYGVRESWIKNHTFAMTTWDRDTAQFENWEHVGGQPISFEDGLEGDKEGIEMMPDGTGSSYYAVQEFGTYAKTCSDIFVFSFDYRLMKPTGADATNVTFKIIVADSTFTYYLNDADDEVNTTASWGTTYHTIERVTATVTRGLGSWVSVTYTISTGLPIAGPYKIYLFSADTAGVRLGYKNVRFYSTSDTLATMSDKVSKWPKWANAIPLFGIIRFFGGGYYNVSRPTYIDNNVEIVSRSYEVDNAIRGVDGSQDYILGDCEDTNIVNVLEQFKGSLAIYEMGSLAQTAIDFVNTNAADYLVGGVILTSNNANLVFTSNAAGTNFTGNTTITNGAADLAGTVVNTVANAAGTVQIEYVTLTGGSGSADISALGQVWFATWNTSLTQTAADFVTAYAADFVPLNITLTSNAQDIIFTETAPTGGFDAPSIENSTGTLDGGIFHIQAPTAGAARIDTISLTGSSGWATVVCDGVSKTITYHADPVYVHTQSWHTRGNTEAQPIIELTADEVADMYSKGRHFIQMSLYELSESLDIIKNLQDPLNVVGANNRVFAFNRGSLDCQMREWTADYIEIGNK